MHGRGDGHDDRKCSARRQLHLLVLRYLARNLLVHHHECVQQALCLCMMVRNELARESQPGWYKLQLN
jgi:hypothetical protein